MIDELGDEGPPQSDGAPLGEEGGRYYQGTIVRVYYGSETGLVRSDATGREYRFKWPFVEIRGPIPRVNGLREGMRVGFDVGWTSSGLMVTVVRVEE
ncbi:MAG TPA: hypothetical protein VMS22_11965 [Candidatus Eisenbacteria bacterium]|nr:hypothetical protein [Candidatus Eisenbacteria bacterium]